MQTPPHYLAMPHHGKGPGVLVLHSWWGLNGFFKGLCDRLARSGFVAMAPDLYGGRVAATVDEARRLRADMTASRKQPAYKLLMAAIDELTAHPAVTPKRIALLGCSMGGHWALWLAQRAELPLAAAVIFYAARNGDYTASRCRFLFHLAEQDDWVSAPSVKKLRKSLDAAGRGASFHVYSGTTHWFFESDRADAFNEQATELAWQRTLAFLHEGFEPAPAAGATSR
jgi:carboxymethylenebutenolidase